MERKKRGNVKDGADKKRGRAGGGGGGGGAGRYGASLCGLCGNVLAFRRDTAKGKIKGGEVTRDRISKSSGTKGKKLKVGKRQNKAGVWEKTAAGDVDKMSPVTSPPR